MSVKSKAFRTAAALAIGAGVVTTVTGCGESAPKPTSDSGHSFSGNSVPIPVDEQIYKLQGKVVSEIQSHSQTNAGGSWSGSTYNGYGSSGGSFWVETTGKGFVRLSVESMTPANPKLGAPGKVVMLKTTDQKVMGLHPGDIVRFTCRADYENVGAVLDNEEFDSKDVERMGTWELDLCRMTDPDIGKMESPAPTPSPSTAEKK